MERIPTQASLCKKAGREEKLQRKLDKKEHRGESQHIWKIFNQGTAPCPMLSLRRELLESMVKDLPDGVGGPGTRRRDISPGTPRDLVLDQTYKFQEVPSLNSIQQYSKSRPRKQRKMDPPHPSLSRKATRAPSKTHS